MSSTQSMVRPVTVCPSFPKYTAREQASACWSPDAGRRARVARTIGRKRICISTPRMVFNNDCVDATTSSPATQPTCERFTSNGRRATRDALHARVHSLPEEGGLHNPSVLDAPDAVEDRPTGRPPTHRRTWTNFPSVRLHHDVVPHEPDAAFVLHDIDDGRRIVRIALGVRADTLGGDGRDARVTTKPDR